MDHELKRETYHVDMEMKARCTATRCSEQFGMHAQAESHEQKMEQSKAQAKAKPKPKSE